MSTTYTCPTCGSESATSDYCDTCGAAIEGPSTIDPLAVVDPSSVGSPVIDPSAVAPSGVDPLGAPASVPPAAAAGAPATCYFCGAPRNPGDVFCEVCGLDFVSGRMPAPAPTSATVGGAPSASGAPTTVGGVPSGWTAMVGADRAFFDGNVTAGVVAFPDAISPREVPLAGDEVSIGRRSESKGYYPDIDLSTPVDDPAVSRRHAVLQRQADGSWAALDVGSTNGTWLNDEIDPLAHGVLRALHEGDRLLLGAFSCITIHRDQPAPAP